jgi:hypothetical protein
VDNDDPVTTVLNRTRSGQATSCDEAWPPLCDYLFSVRTVSVPRMTEPEVPAKVAFGLVV